MRDRPPAANPKLVAWFGLETSPGAFTLRAETFVRRLQILPTKLSAATTKTALTFGARQTWQGDNGGSGSEPANLPLVRLNGSL